MALYTGFPLCFLLWIFSPAAGKEFTVTCLNLEECVLPCQFQSDGKGVKIIWYKNRVVVSCTRHGNTDFVKGHMSQANEYKGRTALYKDQVLKGNSTLLLRNVTPQDQGKYVCITITEPESKESCIISLVVKALVREVDVEFGGDSVTFRAEGIYPAPNLTWSTDPPSDPGFLKDKTKSQKTRLGLYDIKSSLMLKENTQTYICCVSSDTNKKTTFLKHEASIQACPGRNMMLPCSFPHSVLQSFKLTWRFGRSDPILSISITNQKSQVKVWDHWKLHVPDDLSASRSLKLHKLKSEHQGTFTCEVSTPEEKYITQTDVTLTAKCKQHIYIFVSIGLVFFLSFAAVVFCYSKNRRSEQEGEGKEEES
ncbi:V-set domain-containing T-cell activation inhibitor 1-like [Thunnus thynnus]|uniref:V-set domain-containing T-cell activation inhibitor 1-like n=1 Tax=Thunnus thynnus TaxID=8237 RepID=UPI0035274BFF